jgi:hypothetical protein
VETQHVVQRSISLAVATTFPKHRSSFFRLRKTADPSPECNLHFDRLFDLIIG